MTIAIIGTGNVGRALGRGWSKAGHAVVYGTRSPDGDSAQKALADTARARLAAPDEAARDAEVVVLAVPWNAAEAVVDDLGDLGGRVLVDATNPIGPGITHAAATSGGEQVAAWAANARVVKAFNTTGWENMADADYGDHRPAMFIAGDDADAKTIVADLAEALGFEAVDAGPMSRSRELEHLATLWVSQAVLQGRGRDFAFAVLRR
jgi:predicted dinucleotide-binding enzyme